MDYILNTITKDLKEHKELLRNYSKSSTKENQLKGIEVNAKSKAKYFNDAVKNEVELIAKLGRKWKSSIAAIGAFVDIYQYLTPNDYYVSFPISTTSKRLLQVFKNPMKISRVLNDCQSIGLLKCVNESYSYKKGTCKEYLYNKDLQKLVKKVIKEYNINITRNIIKNYKEVEDNDTIISMVNTFKIKFSSKLRIGGVKNEEQLLPILHEKYPQLKRFQLLADKLNEDLPEELLIRFQPSFNFSKCGYVTKIGIRATNSIVSLKEHENEHKDYKGVWRKDFLKEYFGTEDYYEYDVKSSIYRIAYLLKNGVWLDEQYDVYEMMNGQPFATKEERDNYKAFAQRLYFDSPAKIYNNIKSAIGSSIKAYGEVAIKNAIKEAKERMEDVIGGSIDSEIFLHESCIYMDFYSKLRVMGLDVVQVYDGFYCKEDLSIYKDLLESLALDYYNSYIKDNKEIEEEINNTYYISMVNTFEPKVDEPDLVDLMEEVELDDWNYAHSYAARMVRAENRQYALEVEKALEYGYYEAPAKEDYAKDMWSLKGSI